jgi:NADH-quinone oxidoreductase subunit A
VINYVPLGLQILMAVGLAAALLGLSYLLGHRKHSRTDLSPYECGVPPLEPAGKRYTIRFYMVAMLFILFDIETAFLYPWAAVFREMAKKGLGMQGFGEMALFVGVLVVGLVYCWRRGALDWE